MRTSNILAACDIFPAGQYGRGEREEGRVISSHPGMDISIETLPAILYPI